MILLTVLAVATTQPPQIARSSDCKPMLTLAARERDLAEAPNDTVQRRSEQPPRPKRRCMTLASV
ncbi:MAG: hypothetical protein U1E64_12290 [Sphingomonadaceae bacterium]